MAFSRNDFIPTVLKPLPGSVRDVKSISSFLKEFDVSKNILVLDREFFSFGNVEFFIENDIEFIQPLRRALRIIDYSIPLDSFHTYRERGIRYSRVNVTEKFKNTTIKNGKKVFLFMYEVVKLRGEESNLIVLLRNRKIRKYDITRLGKISIRSNLEMDSETIFSIYKGREDVEQSFDAMKNELEEGNARINRRDGFRGYFLMSFISLSGDISILQVLKGKSLSQKLSPQGGLFGL